MSDSQLIQRQRTKVNSEESFYDNESLNYLSYLTEECNSNYIMEVNELSYEQEDLKKKEFILEHEKNTGVLKSNDVKIALVLTLLSLAIRFLYIHVGNRPVWDEVHFGKFATFYINGQHHNDVHPPLAKLLIAWFLKIFNYQGDFDFYSDDDKKFKDDVWWIYGARALCAIVGGLIVPLGYLTLRLIKVRFECALLAAWLLIFDNGIIVISKFLLLDPFLLLFSSLITFCIAGFYTCRKRPFTVKWWGWLIGTGISLGLNSSCKWGVPLFLMGVIGLYTIDELWSLYCDKKIKMITYLYHWLARILCLIVLPILIYLFWFEIHFKVLVQPHKEVHIMDSQFMIRMPKHNLTEVSLDIANNANITLRACKLSGGLLHSHQLTYPIYDKAQQVTGFHQFDSNNDWNIRIVNKTEEEFEIVKDRTIVEFYHQQTKKFLMINNKEESYTKGDQAYLVIAEDYNSNKAEAYQFELRVYDDRQRKEIDVPHAITTRFQLYNKAYECLLSSPDRQLPEWGDFQQEIVCYKPNHGTLIDSLWNVENNDHFGVNKVNKSYFKRKYFYDLFRVHHAMWSRSSIIEPDLDHFEPIESNAWEWPLLLRGIRMTAWGDEYTKFFMAGNPIVWCLSFLGVIVYLIFNLIIQIYLKRGKTILSYEENWTHFFMDRIILINYLAHYLPFFIIGRVLYLHHYFPALYFAIILTPYALDCSLMKFLNEKKRNLIFITIGLSVLAMYLFLFPITYGYSGDIENLRNRQWVKSWLLVD